MTVNNGQVARLGADEATLLSHFGGWRLPDDGQAIARTLVFEDFVAAFAFITEVAVFAKRLNHHPECSNVYNRVVIRLTTPDYHGLSTRDFQLAKRIDKIADACGLS